MTGRVQRRNALQCDERHTSFWMIRRFLMTPSAFALSAKRALRHCKRTRVKLRLTPLSSYLRAFVAARSRCAEDELALGIRRGVRQYVILGAGLDTFAYRNPHPQGTLHVLEVDHPATQAWKRTRLDEVGIALPDDLTFAPV